MSYLFTGHWHANRMLVHRKGIVEWNTQTLVMGSIDHSPAGYRVWAQLLVEAARQRRYVP